MISNRGIIPNIFFSALSIIAIVVIVINGITISQKNRSINNLIKKNNNLEQEFRMLSFNDSINLAIQSDYSIRFDKKLKTTKEASINLSGIITDNIVIFNYSKLSCNECIEDEMLLLRKLIHLIGIENVIIITDYNDISQLFRFQRINNIEDVQVYISENNTFSLTSNIYTFPYYVVIDKSLRIKSFFVPDKESNNMTLRYYRLISRHFFASNL